MESNQPDQLKQSPHSQTFLKKSKRSIPLNSSRLKIAPISTVYKFSQDSCALSRQPLTADSNLLQQQISHDNCAFHFAFSSRATVLHSDNLPRQSLTLDNCFLDRKS